MNIAARPFVKLAQNNRLANYRLLTAISAMEAAEFTKERTSFFPSLWQTLNHILVVDWYYVDALEGGTLGVDAWKDETPFDDPLALRTAQGEVDERLLAFCKQLDAAQMDKIVQLHNTTEPVENVLLHLFQHQIHHRGQAHAMLTGSPIKPPQLDEFLFAIDQPYRTQELADIGWTEADLV
ncbi:DinB family protein [Maritalea mediterranea]|uniref:DinB family protein n=1 Tax=Maritalea mediterranea TaxID=2909667 RepID=A0ABS9E2F0_9HYPH|nr:DinB family protein [Maritalea mediterranea]MCF4096958.1 DinB family protein [Maritalea mediterranea]